MHIKMAFVTTLGIQDVCHVINRHEERLRAERPEIRWGFIEPDIPKTPSQLRETGDKIRKSDLRV